MGGGRKSLSDHLRHRALQGLRELVTEGDLLNWPRISEQRIADELTTRLGRMSRTPVRDAVKVLVEEGILDQVPQVGIQVREYSDRDIRELYVMRELVEPFAAGQMAIIGTHSHWDRLEALISEMEAAAEQVEISRFLGADVQFHQLTAEPLQMPMLNSVLDQTGMRVRVIGFKSSPNQKTMRHVINEHRAILDAIQSRDRERAEKEAHTHIDKTKKRLVKTENRDIFVGDTNNV